MQNRLTRISVVKRKSPIIEQVKYTHDDVPSVGDDHHHAKPYILIVLNQTGNLSISRNTVLGYFDRHANMKYKDGNRHFWCRGYYVDTVGRNKKVIEEYIRNQL